VLEREKQDQRPTEGEFRCCIPGCQVTGAKTGNNPPLTQLGDGEDAHVLCYCCLADWWNLQGAEIRRAPTAAEWRAFLTLRREEAA